ncbi:MAG TPA: hypothetical protein PKO33_16725 [Pyrinomonadaceae bacterium]|nr:hypothetical protein [Pyrinomonadaceae bacterium]
MIREKNDTIKIYDLPVSVWLWGSGFTVLFGGVLLLILSFAWNTPHQFIGSPGQGLLQRGLTILMFLGAVAFLGALTFVFLSITISPIKITTVDRRNRTVLVRSRGIFSQEGDRFPFSQINGFGIDNDAGSPFETFVALVLVNDEKIRLESTARRNADDLAERLNSFIAGE